MQMACSHPLSPLRLARRRFLLVKEAHWNFGQPGWAEARPIVNHPLFDYLSSAPAGVPQRIFPWRQWDERSW